MSPLRFCSSLLLLQIARLLSPTRRVQNFTRSCPIVSIRFEKIGERTDLIFIQSFFFFHSSKRGRYPAEAADKLFQHAGAVQTHEVSTIYNIRVRSHLKEVEGRRIGSIDSEGGKLKNLARFIIVGANFSKLYIFPWNKIQERGQLKLSLVDTILVLPMRYEITSETTWIIFLTSIRDRRNSRDCQRITRPLSLLLEKRKLKTRRRNEKGGEKVWRKRLKNYFYDNLAGRDGIGRGAFNSSDI